MGTEQWWTRWSVIYRLSIALALHGMAIRLLEKLFSLFFNIEYNQRHLICSQCLISYIFILHILYILCICISSFQWYLCFIPIDMEKMLHSSLKKPAFHQIAVITPFFCDRFMTGLYDICRRIVRNFWVNFVWQPGNDLLTICWGEQHVFLDQKLTLLKGKCYL